MLEQVAKHAAHDDHRLSEERGTAEPRPSLRRRDLVDPHRIASATATASSGSKEKAPVHQPLAQQLWDDLLSQSPLPPKRAPHAHARLRAPYFVRTSSAYIALSK